MMDDYQMRVLCGYVGAFLMAIAALACFMGVVGSFGSYYDHPGWGIGLIAGPLFAAGQHHIALCAGDQGDRSLVKSCGDYLVDTLVAMGLICLVTGNLARDESAHLIGIAFLSGAIIVFLLSRLFALTHRP